MARRDGGVAEDNGGRPEAAKFPVVPGTAKESGRKAAGGFKAGTGCMIAEAHGPRTEGAKPETAIAGGSTTWESGGGR